MTNSSGHIVTLEYKPSGWMGGDDIETATYHINADRGLLATRAFELFDLEHPDAFDRWCLKVEKAS